MSDSALVAAVPRVDVRAARLSQALVAAAVIGALLLRAPALLALAALHLALSAALGRRGNAAVRFFDAALRPRLGPPSWEDARPPRFANLVGATFLAAALAAHAAGAPTLGWALAGIVGALALVASTTGACLGCWLYGYLGPLRSLVRWIG
jgi:hypothetical protein